MTCGRSAPSMRWSDEHLRLAVPDDDLRDEPWPLRGLHDRGAPGRGPGGAAAVMKCGGKPDLRGGGQLSGRMTAPLVVSGAIARQVLEAKSIQFFAHAAQIGRVTADAVTPKQIEANVERTPVRCADLEAADRMIAEIEEARKGRDSVGGVIEGMVTGLPPGIGEPFFDSVESSLAHLLCSIPAVKGVDFGAGFRGPP